MASSGEASEERSEGGGADAVEVLAAAPSRPARLLQTDGVQLFLKVLTRLKDVPGEGGDETALKTLLRKAVDSAGELGNSEVPENFIADVDEAVEAAESMMSEVSESPEDGLNWRKPLEQFSRLRLAKRLPEMTDEVLPWDSVYPASFAGKTGVEQTELRHAVRSFARELDLQELASWTEEEFDEAESLIQRNDVLKEVYAVAAKAVEGTIEELVGTAAAVAGFVAFVPVALAGLVVASCLSLLEDGGSGGGVAGGGVGAPVTGLSAQDLGVLPVYKLGGLGSL